MGSEDARINRRIEAASARANSSVAPMGSEDARINRRIEAASARANSSVAPMGSEDARINRRIEAASARANSSIAPMGSENAKINQGVKGADRNTDHGVQLVFNVKGQEKGWWEHVDTEFEHRRLLTKSFPKGEGACAVLAVHCLYAHEVPPGDHSRTILSHI